MCEAMLSIHAFGNLNVLFGVLVLLLLVVAWRGMVVFASCKQQHIILKKYARGYLPSLPIFYIFAQRGEYIKDTFG